MRSQWFSIPFTHDNTKEGNRMKIWCQPAGFTGPAFGPPPMPPSPSAASPAKGFAPIFPICYKEIKQTHRHKPKSSFFSFKLTSFARWRRVTFPLIYSCHHCIQLHKHKHSRTSSKYNRNKQCRADGESTPDISILFFSLINQKLFFLPLLFYHFSETF